MIALQADAAAAYRRTVAPLLGRREPLPGESLMSVVARACAASGFRTISTVLNSIGITSTPPFVPFTQIEHAANLAALLRVREDQILSRMHPGGREVVDWWGEPLRRVYLEAKTRRYSPASLAVSVHHRAVWMIRPLPFCPESFEILRSDCPACQRSLGWSHTRGIDRCDHCGAALSDAVVEQVDAASRTGASRVASLVSVDSRKRRQAVKSLPAPFDQWRPGDVFEAVVELGVAHRRLDDVSLRQGAVLLGEGRYQEITTPVLIAGLETLDQWPASLTTLVDRIGASTNIGGSTGLEDCLGPFSKFLQSHRAGSPLYDAIAAEAATAFRAALIPVKSTALDRIAPPEDDGLISEKEALEKFDIYQKHLRRLDGVSDTMVLRRASVSKLYDRDHLSTGVAAFRAAMTPPEVVRTLGAPEFVLAALADKKLLKAEANPDAVLLSGYDFLITSASVDRLMGRAERLWRSSGSERQPLSRVLQHVFSPEAWAAALELAITSAATISDDTGASLMDRLMVAPETIYHALLQSSWTFPASVGVSCITAGKLTGQSDVLMSKAVTENAVAGVIGPRSHTIRLADLRAFSTDYAFTNDIAARLSCSPPTAAKALRAAGVRPSRLVYRMALWNRTEAEAALGLEPLAQHRLRQCPHLES